MTGNSEVRIDYRFNIPEKNPRKTEDTKVIIEKTLLSQIKFRVYKSKMLTKKHFLTSGDGTSVGGGLFFVLFCFFNINLRILFCVYTTVSLR